VRIHGWSGSAPASDEEAIARILDAAGKAIDERGADDFQNRLDAHLQGSTHPVEAVTEAIATALEWLPKNNHLGLLIVFGRPNSHIESVTGDVALDFAHSMVRRFEVN
jgi:hypothetical protein